MYQLNTSHPTIVYKDYLLDPSIMDNLPNDKNKNDKRNVVFYDYSEKCNYYCNFVRDITSGFLEMNGYEHNKNKWYMDIIRYRLNDDTKRVSSGLAWHCENDNYPNVITVLLYLRIDEGIIDGNIRYKDVNNEKKYYR